MGFDFESICLLIPSFSYLSLVIYITITMHLYCSINSTCRKTLSLCLVHRKFNTKIQRKENEEENRRKEK